MRHESASDRACTRFFHFSLGRPSFQYLGTEKGLARASRLSQRVVYARDDISYFRAVPISKAVGPPSTFEQSRAREVLPSFTFRAPLSLGIFSVSLTLLPRDIRIIDNYYRSRYYRTRIFRGYAELTIVRVRAYDLLGGARVIERIQYRFSNVRLSLTGSYIEQRFGASSQRR